MKVEVKSGDLLDETADVIVSTANPWLAMSGGVNGAILCRGGDCIQEELREYLRSLGMPAVPPGSIVRTGPGSLSARHLLHAVAIDVFYSSNTEVVRQTIESALEETVRLGAFRVAMPALATGYGRLSIADFGQALRRALRRDWRPIASLIVVLRRDEDVETVRLALAQDRNED